MYCIKYVDEYGKTHWFRELDDESTTTFETVEEAEEKIRKYAKMGYSTAYVCISKTPNSFTDDPKILGAPEGHTVHIRDVKLYAGANLIVPLSGSVMLLPGLPKKPLCLDEFN